MSLYTKCILHEPKHEDGWRISVMSRHTHNDGKTLDLRIRAFDDHIPQLGPSPGLIGAYYRKELKSWEQFAQAYRLEIKMEPKKPFVDELVKMATLLEVTILCIEETPEFCHRRLLAEYCKELSPSLIVVHR